ncbi:MerR family transcriptional regulator [Streptomyces sp. NPDC050504]|uniref:MerR family transcriptional regulator n=1 Tax=Streptomyces sp. NPDC050504 TaxID=3365618 RepID=UPI00379F442E
MRIGELASLVGVTPRAVRHYHHRGLLPEPRRLGNGYREYGLRDAVLLARIKRLTELGLGLDEVRDVLADDAGRELVEVLGGLDADLARQESGIRERRARLAVLIREARAGTLPAQGPFSPELTALLGDVARASAGLPESPMAARDREILALLDTAGTPEERGRLLAAMRSVTGAPGAAERAHAVYAMLDALVDAAPSDPAVDEAAAALAALVPVEALGAPGRDAELSGPVVDAMFADFAPAQAEAVRRAMRIAAARQDGPS